MAHALSRTLAFFRWAIAAAAVGAAVLLTAVTFASARYDTCGASRLDASDGYCRLGIHLLMTAYGLLAGALVLGAVSLTLLWRTRRRLRRMRRPES